MSLRDWSKTASSNSSVGLINFAENQPANTLNDSARALMADVASWRDDLEGTLTTTGAANTYVLTTNQGVVTLANGTQIAAKINVSNTGASTLNVDTRGAKAIRKLAASGDIDLVAGEIVANGRYIFQYDMTANSAAGAWIVLNPCTDPAIATATASAVQKAGDTMTGPLIVPNFTYTGTLTGTISLVQNSSGPWIDAIEIVADLPTSVHQIVIRLQAQEKTFRETKVASQSEVCIGSYCAFAQNNFIDTTRRHANGARQRVLTKAKRLQEFFVKDFAGGWIGQEFRHDNRRCRHGSVLLQSTQTRHATDH